VQTVFAGIYEQAPRAGSRAREMVRRALAQEGGAEVRELGPLTLGWTGPDAHAAADLICVVDGRARPKAAADAYRRHGADAPGALRDDFALVVWDASRARGLLARDPLGIGAVFVATTGGALAFATELRTLLRLLPSRPAPDELAVTHWIARGSEAPGHTFYS